MAAIPIRVPNAETARLLAPLDAAALAAVADEEAEWDKVATGFEVLGRAGVVAAVEAVAPPMGAVD
jgi:hypothetical protein